MRDAATLNLGMKVEQGLIETRADSTFLPRIAVEVAACVW